MGFLYKKQLPRDLKSKKSAWRLGANQRFLKGEDLFVLMDTEQFSSRSSTLVSNLNR